MNRLFLATTLLATTGLAAWATEPPKAPELPPEVKKTVEALAGKWSATTTMTMPGAKAPVKFSEKMECKRASGGRAASCTENAKVPGMGTMDFTHLVSYDPERKAVHWFAVGSTGEVHDHVCHWTDDKTLDCDPLKATLNGGPITEIVKMVFDGNKFTVIATTTTKEGDTKVEMVGKRGS
jgi:hypothetical protein